MIKLYRGILDRFNCNNLSLENDIRELVRESLKETNDTAYGSYGFWNFLLEICLTLFIKTYMIAATLLAISLATVFFPLNAVKNALTSLFDRVGNPTFQNNEVKNEIRIEPYTINLSNVAVPVSLTTETEKKEK